MGKTLCIAETPSAGQDIARVLGCKVRKNGYIEGDKYIVTWAVGHLIGLKQPDEINVDYKKWSLDPLPFCFDYDSSLKVLEGTKDQFKVIKELIHREDVDDIINCGDAGREGYLIQELIYQIAGNKKPKKVLWASSLTEEALLKAFKNLHDASEFDRLLEEAKARQYGDYMYGMNYSRSLTLLLGNGKVLRYGRCQTPLLALLAKRENEINSFKPTKYYEVQANYEGFHGALMRDAFKNKGEINDFIARLSGEGIVKAFKCDDKETQAPTLYSLSDLQVDMGKKFKFAPDRTLEIAQALYEKYKVTTYPRTDSNVIPNDVWNEIQGHIDSVICIPEFQGLKVEIANKPNKRYVNDGKVTDHHAIIPTINSQVLPEIGKMDKDEKNVFMEICKRFLAIFFPIYKYKSSELIVSVGEYDFKSTGNMISDLGWKCLYKGEEGDMGDLLPTMSVGDKVEIKEYVVLEKVTKAPSRYNVSSITSLQKAHGLGTSATLATFPKKLQESGYIELKKGKYFVTPLGMEYIKVIPEELKASDLSKQFEDKLSKVNEGDMDFEKFKEMLCEEQRIMIAELIKQGKINNVVLDNTKAAIGICPLCGKPVLENSKAYYCSGWKQGCPLTIWKTISGKTLTEKHVKDLLDKRRLRTTMIKGFKTKDGKDTFDSVLGLGIDGRVHFLFDDK